jgi:uncharacterized membrane protein YhdT
MVRDGAILGRGLASSPGPKGFPEAFFIFSFVSPFSFSIFCFFFYLFITFDFDIQMKSNHFLKISKTQNINT